MQTHEADVAIVGGGVVGLAHAYFALRKGLKVVLFERDTIAVGASVRNFGMIWPIGQEKGIGLDLAMRNRKHWLDITTAAGIWCNQNGSLHLAYHRDELDVLEEFVSANHDAGYDCEMINADAAVSKSQVIRHDGLKGAMWSGSEMTVYSRDAIRKIPQWLTEKFGLITRFGHVVTDIQHPVVKTAREIWRAQRVVVCSGADFETLFPEAFALNDVVKCRLQMLKASNGIGAPQGPSLCAGLTLLHYAAFSKCVGLEKVARRYHAENPKLEEAGIHILVSQNHLGEYIIGDSHHYFKTVEPFDHESVYDLILEYFNKFIPLEKFKIIERWHGVYPKVRNQLNLVLEPQPGVQIVNGLGGAGMTLSFGIAEEIVSAWH